MSEATAWDSRSGDRGTPPIPEHPDIAEWRMATPDDIDAIHSVFAAADAVDHPSWITPREDVADTFDLPHIDQSRDTIIGFGADGAAIAAGSAMLHPSREQKLSVHVAGAVHPQWRRRGIGRRLFAWQDARGQQQVAEAAGSVPDDHPKELKTYAEDINTGHKVLAAAFGYAPERWFATMVRPQAAVPEVPRAVGIDVVIYSHDRDLDALAARNDAFRDHWGSLPTTEESWRKFVGGEFLRPDLSRLAVDADGRIVAFCLVSVNRDDWESRGRSNAYIDLIGVVRDRRGQRLAPLVISEALRAISEAGIEEAILDVDTESPTGANSLYAGLGFVPEERSVALVRHL